jgi:hypothetical protein
MKNLFGNNKTYIFFGLGILIAIGAWWGLSGEAPSNSLLTSQGSSELGPTEKNLVDTLLQLRAVSLSGTIFSDPSFVVLRDFGTQIIPEPIGRENPFAPLSDDPIPSEEESQSSAPPGS